MALYNKYPPTKADFKGSAKEVNPIEAKRDFVFFSILAFLSLLFS